MSQPERLDDAARDGSRDASTTVPRDPSGCLVCGKSLVDTRAKFCSPAHRQLAYRVRRRPAPVSNESDLRRLLQRQRQLTAHTLYECPNCQDASSANVDVDPVNSFAERSDSAVAVRNATNPSCFQTSSNSTRTTLDYPQHRTHGCGHDALLTQSLDNRCAVTHMTTLQHYDGPPLVVSPDISTAHGDAQFSALQLFTSAGPGCTFS